MCSHCRRILVGQDDWRPVEQNELADDSLRISHGICPACLKRHFPEFS
jgi:hypothetical protein